MNVNPGIRLAATGPPLFSNWVQVCALPDLGFLGYQLWNSSYRILITTPRSQ